MTERWVKQALKAFEKANIYTGSNDLVMRVTVKLLARQHRAFVRMVKRMPCVDGMPACKKCGGISRSELLAALAKQGKGGK